MILRFANRGRSLQDTHGGRRTYTAFRDCPRTKRGRFAAKAEKITRNVGAGCNNSDAGNVTGLASETDHKKYQVVPTECPDARRLRLTFPAWSFGCPKKTAPGIIGGFEVR